MPAELSDEYAYFDGDGALLRCPIDPDSEEGEPDYTDCEVYGPRDGWETYLESDVVMARRLEVEEARRLMETIDRLTRPELK